MISFWIPINSTFAVVGVTLALFGFYIRYFSAVHHLPELRQKRLTILAQQNSGDELSIFIDRIAESDDKFLLTFPSKTPKRLLKISFVVYFLTSFVLLSILYGWSYLPSNLQTSTTLYIVFALYFSCVGFLGNGILFECKYLGYFKSIEDELKHKSVTNERPLVVLPEPSKH